MRLELASLGVGLLMGATLGVAVLVASGASWRVETETVVEQVEVVPANYEYLLDCHNDMTDYMDAPEDSPVETDALALTLYCFNARESDARDSGFRSK